MINLKINSKEINAQENQSVLKAALGNNIYIPHLCSHPDLNEYKGIAYNKEIKPAVAIYQGAKEIIHEPIEQEPGCGLCLIDIKGINDLQKACETIVQPGMEISTETERVKQARQKNLTKILANHPHSCLTCAQSEGCSLTQCSSNVPQNERCCPKFNRCELQKISQYIGISLSTPRYVPQNIPMIDTDPLIKRDYNLCIGCLRCVRACKNLRGIDALGFVFVDGKITVGSKQSSLIDSGCKFCGACIEVCPTGAVIDKVTIGSDRVKSLVPCTGNCPVGMDAPNYIRYIKNRNIDRACEIINHKVPFPSVLGRVCFHPCEENCRRKEIHETTCSGTKESISICALKRYASEKAADLIIPKTEIPNAQLSVAVIGAGPAGLTAAFYLAQKGYKITVFEAEKEIGGMMRYAIPEYRLPLSVLNGDLNKINTHPNIEIKTNQILGNNLTIDSLKQKGFKAILIAIGAQSPKKILEDNKSIVWGIDFLKSIRNNTINQKEFKNKSILIIGGGNVAVDIALSAKRLNANEIQIVCLESQEEMPAHEWEIAQAVDEGINLHFSWGPKGIIQNNNGPSRLILDVIQCTSVFDQNGKFNPSFNGNVCKAFQADIIIAAIGQSPDISSLSFAQKPNKTLKVNEDTLILEENVFACGEVVHNPSSIVEAIADGRKAAANIDKHLGGSGIIDKELQSAKPDPYFGRDEEFFKYKRIQMPSISLSEREGNFNAVEKGYTKEMAEKEAMRCLQCDARLYISPVVFPPETSSHLGGKKIEELDFTESSISNLPKKEGVYILLNENKETLVIKGALNLQQALLEQLNNSKAKYFRYEIDPMYTKKESELIQQYLQKHGKLPAGGDELDDLF